MSSGWPSLQAGVQGATEVPVYIVDEDMSPALLLKKASNLGLGGWWLGGTHMKPNQGFIGAVQQKVPKDAKLIVTCQKGLRCGLSITNTLVAKMSGVTELFKSGWVAHT